MKTLLQGFFNQTFSRRVESDKFAVVFLGELFCEDCQKGNEVVILIPNVGRGYEKFFECLTGESISDETYRHPIDRNCALFQLTPFDAPFYPSFIVRRSVERNCGLCLVVEFVDFFRGKLDGPFIGSFPMNDPTDGGYW